MDSLFMVILIVIIFLVVRGSIQLNNMHDYSGDLKKDKESNSLKEIFKDFF